MTFTPENHNLTDFSEENLLRLLSEGHPDLISSASRIVHEHFNGKVYFRALIEISSYCHNGCYYCGLRVGNPLARRYRMSTDQVLRCCEYAASKGYRTFVLQGGEDPIQNDDWMTELVRRVHAEFPECAITLSVGERSDEAYLRFRDAGVDRYLLRHETASPEHYGRLHPASMSLENRKHCLHTLKRLGYQTGAGMMVGSPHQTLQDLVRDLLFLQELGPHMIGVGPFIPAAGTPFENEKSGSISLTLRVLSILRLMFPYANIPSTTALASLQPDGDLLGLAAGANVIMTDFTPPELRAQYAIYDHKSPSDHDLHRYEDAGWVISMERGDNYR